MVDWKDIYFCPSCRSDLKNIPAHLHPGHPEEDRKKCSKCNLTIVAIYNGTIVKNLTAIKILR